MFHKTLISSLIRVVFYSPKAFLVSDLHQCVLQGSKNKIKFVPTHQLYQCGNAVLTVRYYRDIWIVICLLSWSSSLHLPRPKPQKHVNVSFQPSDVLPHNQYTLIESESENLIHSSRLHKHTHTDTKTRTIQVYPK